MNYRKFKFTDVFKFSHMLSARWRLGKNDKMSKHGGSYAGILYTLLILEVSHQLWVAEYQGKTAGFVGIGTGGSKMMYKLWRKLILSFLSHSDRQIYNDYYQHYEYSMLQSDKKQAELTILIVSPAFQGQKLGSHLTDIAISYAQKIGCESIYALTDSLCKWDFYEHKGFSRIFEKYNQNGSLENDSGSETLYIYQKKL